MSRLHVRWAVLVLGLLAVPASAADPDRSVRELRFSKGASSAVVKGRITGRQYVDHTIRAAAGQAMTATLATKKPSIGFNVLPPGSQDAAMYIGDGGAGSFSGLLPDDGTYTVRVFLVRAAARRGESGDYELTVGVTGAPLAALPAKADAKVPGTRFHATTSVPCQPAYGQPRECAAGVVRRGRDGTATVELTWDKGGKRRILFVKGEPKASDAPQPMTARKGERGDTRVTFEGGEWFDVPEALVSGG